MVYEFDKPYEFEGKTYNKLEFDLEGMTGADFAAAKRAFAKSGSFAAVPTADSEFCAVLLARLVKQPIEFFEGLPVKDYCALTQSVSNFLLG
jgi:hypothetical protein